MSLANYLKKKAADLVALTRSLWSPARLADRFHYNVPLRGHRLMRTGKHKDTRLTRHEQTRNPAGSKLWKCRAQYGGA